MPGKVKVKVLAGRNLPVMDRASDTSDAFAEVKLGNTTFKTDVYRKSLNPHWNSEWFKFEMEDEELQDEPLQIRVMDYDTYSANDAIGKVYIDLNPLLLCRDLSSALSGWIPIYDTMHGIRGEVNVIVKVELFSDLNRFRDSSCGIQFFCGAGIPHGFKVLMIHGFVEELVVNDDPEYQWIDKIRTPRASNEARQTLFSKLSGEVQRKIGLKALELGGNTVVGYQQCFDLEGESGIVVRGIGTSVTLVRQIQEPSQHASSPIRETTRDSPGLDEGQLSTSPVETSNNRLSQSPAKYGISYVHKSYESDPNFTTPKASTISGTGNSTNVSGSHRQQRRHVLTQDSVDMLEYPFLSMTQFPPGFIIHLGGVVSARSVKLLGRMNNPDEPETRDTWWTELRMEIRAHARALGCNVVLGYSEATSICDDVCLMSASGTAAVANFRILGTSSDRRDAAEKVCFQSLEKEPVSATDVGARIRHLSDGNEDCTLAIPCSICHIPYTEASVPFPVTLVKCAICGKSRVPDLLFTTIEIPYNIPTIGKGCLVQARVCRPKKDTKGEANAKEISDSLPFLEYDLHRQLLIKLKAKGMNALFGLRVQVSVGAKMIIAVATSTGIYLSPLPQPSSPKISSGKTVDGRRSESLQHWIDKTVTDSCKIYGIQQMAPQERTDDVADNEDGLAELDLSSGNKDACVLEIDDSEDFDILTSLIDPDVPNGFDVFNTEEVSGICNIACNLQMFTRVWRSRIPSAGLNTGLFSQMCQNAIQSLFFKLRKMVPCALSNLQFFVDLSDDDEVQIIVLGTTVGLGDPNQLPSLTPASNVTSSSTQAPPKPSAASLDTESDIVFKMDKMEQGVADEGSEVNGLPSCQRGTAVQVAVNVEKSQSSEFKPVSVFTYHKASHHHGIDVSSLSYIPGAKIENYFGNLNFFFIRECTALRESGGLSGFIQSFIAEVFAIVRAHVAALGGNALVSFFMNQCVLMHNPHKNQGQCLINVGGDAVLVVLPVILQPAPDGCRVKRAASPTVPTSQVEAARVVVKARGSPKEVKTLHHVSQG